ncbi:hypothetical protein C0W35_18360 [Photobacterium kishitanii]|uniref:hypothetical protein n=1 Tax=Photobacterium kishitanii TaxID=318456 RepID=UPI000D152B19|nr:hypothetical protein [Photobacterium kishitanii]PSU89967.1 hypothetical protein C0W35_18360 [Photobacterium kishitanii]
MKVIFLIMFMISFTASASLCDENDNIIISCKLNNGKFVSVCEKNNKITYKYGTNDHIEMKFDSTKKNRIKYQDTKYPAGGNTRIYFNKGSFTYYVFNYSTMYRENGITVGSAESNGVAVYRGNDIKFRQNCDTDVLIDYSLLNKMEKTEFNLNINLIDSDNQ